MIMDLPSISVNSYDPQRRNLPFQQPQPMPSDSIPIGQPYSLNGNHDDFAASSLHHQMQQEVFKYLSEQESRVIEKYLDEHSPASPCVDENPEEFYHLYAAILRTCPKAAPQEDLLMSMGPHNTAARLRAQFDAIYENYGETLVPCWNQIDSIRANEIEQLRSIPFVAHFDASPTMQYSQYSSLPIGARTLTGFPVGYLYPPRENFTQLKESLGQFDFEKHGLNDIADRIIAFYNGEPIDSPPSSIGGSFSEVSLPQPQRSFPIGEHDLFTVLNRVFTQLREVDTFDRSETIEKAVKQRFTYIFDHAAKVPEQVGGLTGGQASQIDALLGRSCVRRRPKTGKNTVFYCSIHC